MTQSDDSLITAKRSYNLPAKLLDRFAQECEEFELPKSWIVAGAILAFLNSTPIDQAGMMDRLEKFTTRAVI